MSNWLAQKLGQQPGGGIVVQPQVVHQPQYVQPQQPFQQAPVQVPQGYQLVPVVDGRGSFLSQGFDQNSIGRAMKMWQGGEAMRTEGNLTCPRCNSAHYSYRAAQGAGSTIMNKDGVRATPAPICYDCGYSERGGNGYVQGDQSNWVGAAA
jgi:hypothetical protein